MKRFFPMIILALLGSALFGWLRAGTSAGAQLPAVDGWEAMQYSPPTNSDYAVMAAKVKASSLLPLSLIAEGKQGGATAKAVSGPNDAPPFPKFRSSMTRNSVRYVTLEGADNTNITVKSGDVLESGWEIKSITRKSFFAVFDGEEIEVPKISYLQSAFEKPTEDAMDGKTDLDGATNTPTRQRQGGGE